MKVVNNFYRISRGFPHGCPTPSRKMAGNMNKKVKVYTLDQIGEFDQGNMAEAPKAASFHSWDDSPDPKWIVAYFAWNSRGVFVPPADSLPVMEFSSRPGLS